MKDKHVDVFMGATSVPQASFIELEHSPGIRFIGDMMGSPAENLEYEFKAKLDMGGLFPAIRISEKGYLNMGGHSTFRGGPPAGWRGRAPAPECPGECARIAIAE